MDALHLPESLGFVIFMSRGNPAGTIVEVTLHLHGELYRALMLTTEGLCILFCRNRSIGIPKWINASYSGYRFISCPCTG